mgnify:CR=1 FL=1
MRRTLTALSFAFSSATAAVLTGFFTPMALADTAVLNIYSARHYPTDEALYSDFTKATRAGLAARKMSALLRGSASKVVLYSALV